MLSLALLTTCCYISATQPNRPLFDFLVKELLKVIQRKMVSIRRQHTSIKDRSTKIFFSDEENFERRVNLYTSHVASHAVKRVVCSVCSCTYLKGEECIRCDQNREYEFSRIADEGNPYTTETPETPESPV